MSATLTGDGLRILVLATDAHGGFGGIAQYNRDVIEAMAGLDRIREITVLPRIAQEGHLALPAKISYDLAGTGGIRSYLSRSLQHAISRGRPDLVYCAHINLFPVARAISAARRVPVVLAIYGIDAWSRPGGFAFRMLAPVADLVISISRITLDRFEAWSSKGRAPTAVLPNAIHASEFGLGNADNPLARRLGIAGRKAILTFGRMSADERYKGFDEVMEVLPRLAARVPGIVYVAAGDGSDRPRLEAKARSLGVADHVVFTGRVRDEDKVDLYRLADAYVMPSSGEGFGFVVLEALACGVPVVASSADGTREAVRGGELGLVVDPKDPGALERAIIEALGKPKAIPPGLDYFSFANFQRRLQAALAQIVPV
jgi:glycosyltransferase involved in cell wall biosynthesis